MRKTRVFTALSLILVMLSSGCTHAEVEQVGGIFVEGQSGGDAETLNWILAADAASFSYVGHTLDTLANYNNQLEIHLLCLAKDVEVSPDGLVYTITIRDDLKWSDGSQVTAEDYVYTLKNLMFSDWLNYPYKNSWQEDVDGDTVFVTPEVVDDTTFTITRQTVDPEFVYIIYDLIPYPKYITTKYEGDVEAFTQAPELNNLTYTGNLGPYKFAEWIRNDRYVVERNPEYYLGKDSGAPYFERYVIKLFGTSATIQAALEAGDITYCGIEPDKVSKFKSLESINVYTVPTASYTLVGYNHRANGWEGLKKTTIRQALSMSIDKQVITDKVYLGFAEPAFSFIPMTSPWYTDEGIAKYGVEVLYDKQKAIELFYQAGYGKKRADGTMEIIDKDDRLLKLILVTTTGGGLAEDIAFLIKQELSDVGIEVELKLVPWETLVRNYLMNKVPGTDQESRYNNGPEAVSDEPWDLVLMGFGTDVLAPSGSGIFFTTEGGLNFFGYFNTEIDKLFKRVRSKEALDKEVRQQIYAEISRILSEEQPVDFLVFRRSNVGFQKNVKGIEPGISMGYNYYLWYFE
ncbi:MAG TPA: ABC transporter substrate-binding protein [Dehalococcoidia bacterium]|nr:ABC transporter substrate-binding protein [Dehalococcoidia bacterium]